MSSPFEKKPDFFAHRNVQMIQKLQKVLVKIKRYFPIKHRNTGERNTNGKKKIFFPAVDKIKKVYYINHMVKLNGWSA